MQYIWFSPVNLPYVILIASQKNYKEEKGKFPFHHNS